MTVGSLALVLRLAWVLLYGRVSATQIDTAFYQIAAIGLSANGNYVAPNFEPTAGWPPGYPFAISVLYRLFGAHPELSLALNVVLATATAPLLYVVADRIFGRATARVAGGMFAILPGPVFFTGLFMSETTFIFIVVAFLALAIFLPDRRWTPVVLGVALGLNPLKEVGLIPRKLVSLNGRSSGVIEGWINQGPPSEWQLGKSSVIVLTVLADAGGYFLLLATLASLAVLGVRALWRSHPGMQGVLAYLALCLVNYGVVYYGQYRYRIPMEPFMVLIAAPLVTAVWTHRRSFMTGSMVTPARQEAAFEPATEPANAASREASTPDPA